MSTALCGWWLPRWAVHAQEYYNPTEYRPAVSDVGHAAVWASLNLGLFSKATELHSVTMEADKVPLAQPAPEGKASSNLIHSPPQSAEDV